MRASAHEGGPLLSYSHSLVLLHCGLHTDCVAPSDALTSLPSSYKYLQRDRQLPCQPAVFGCDSDVHSTATGYLTLLATVGQMSLSIEAVRHLWVVLLVMMLAVTQSSTSPLSTSEDKPGSQDRPMMNVGDLDQLSQLEYNVGQHFHSY